MILLSDTPRDLLGALRRDAAHGFADSSPGGALLTHPSRRLLEQGSDSLFHGFTTDPDGLVLLARVSNAPQGAQQRGNALQRLAEVWLAILQVVGHAARLGARGPAFKLSIDFKERLTRSAAALYLQGQLEAQLTPTGQCPSSGVVQPKSGPDSATPTSQAGPTTRNL